MKISVTAKPSAHEECVEQIDDTHFMVAVKEPPRQGMANRAIIQALAKHFNTAPSNIKLFSGFASRQKIFEVM